MENSQLMEVKCAYTREISGEEHDCPGRKMIAIDDHTSWICPECSQRMHWCPRCKAFCTTTERSRVCDVCHYVI